MVDETKLHWWPQTRENLVAWKVFKGGRKALARPLIGMGNSSSGLDFFTEALPIGEYLVEVRWPNTMPQDRFLFIFDNPL